MWTACYSCATPAAATSVYVMQYDWQPAVFSFLALAHQQHTFCSLHAILNVQAYETYIDSTRQTQHAPHSSICSAVRCECVGCAAAQLHAAASGVGLNRAVTKADAVCAAN